ncbi:hypothetical protein JCM19237_297 [Photobacterium aphoticum]|uniref:Uncharacterized protein n=1 Tax=Photobacterium aphoticum TaxID=754436 RepID=A0A090RKA3_9GAMM|nr:hypothetical protein JCM19237_297 [Photobacterium aphoticum]
MAAVEALQCGDHLTAGENKYHGADTVMLFAGNKAYFISAIDKVERQLAEEREEERRVVCELERMLIHRTMLLNESRLEWYKMAIDMIESDKRPTMMDKLEL